MSNLKLKFKTYDGEYAVIDLHRQMMRIFSKLYNGKLVNLCYENGYIELVNNNFRIGFPEDDYIVYEINYEKIEADEIMLMYDSHYYHFMCNKEEINVLLDENLSISLKDFIEYYSKFEKYEDGKIYEEITHSLALEMFVKDDILKIVYRRYSNTNDKFEINKADSTDVGKVTSPKPTLQNVIIGNILEFNINRVRLTDIVNELYDKEIRFDLKPDRCYIRGHCIEVDCILLETKDFMILFEEQDVRHVYFKESIVDISYYTNSCDEGYNIGEIVKEYRPEKRWVQVTGKGADNAWHYVYAVGEEYAYALGFDL